MITATNLFVKYGDRILLDHLNLVIGEKDKIGLIGRNGAGKSTILKIIAGELTPDEGNLSFPNESTLGFLHQEMSLPKGKTVIQETLTAFDAAKKMEERIQEINDEMAVRTDYESDAYLNLINEFSELNDRFQLLGGQTIEAEAEKVLKGLGFKNKDFNRLTDEFSGGWQMRIELAKMLLQRPDYLLLDEPTNHLDIESIIWLESFLKDYHGAVILISHDRTFLNNIITRTLEIELGKIFDYRASYDKAMLLRAERREKTIAAYQNQQRVIAQKERTITRFMAKATKTKMAQSMQKQLDKLERVEVAEENTAVMNLRFPTAPRSGQVVVEGTNLIKKYGETLVLNEINLKVDRGDRVAFVGQNGQGKTTLAKMIVNVIPASGGALNLGHNVQIGYYAQNQAETLKPNLTLIETMEEHSPPEMRTKLRGILGAFLFSGEDAEKKVIVLSGGERARLALACMLLRPFNLLVLDEPTNHLDISSKEILKKALLDYDGTLLIVSHDRDFLAGLTNRTIEFRDHKLFDHIGDVNTFLEKRALDNMRQVELQKNGRTTLVTNSPKKTLSYEERKKLLRAVSQAEKKIEQLESKIAQLEVQMGDPSFFQNPDSQAILKKYNNAKAELETTMETWEEAQMTLEEYEG